MTILEPVKTFGVMTVYKRKPCPLGAKRYVIFRNASNILLEEFSTRKSALKWAEKNQKG
jgi:hypothetical protein